MDASPQPASQRHFHAQDPRHVLENSLHCPGSGMKFVEVLLSVDGTDQSDVGCLLVGMANLLGGRTRVRDVTLVLAETV